MYDEVGTAGVPPEDRVRHWERAVRSRLAPVEVTPRAGNTDFEGTISGGDAGCVRLLSMRATPLGLSCTARPVPAGRDDGPALILQEQGTATVRQDGRAAVVPAGCMVLLDLARPFRLEQHTPFHLYAVRLPERALGPSATHVPRVTGRAFPGSEGVGALLRPFATEMAYGAATLAGHVRERLAGNLVDLVAALVDEQARLRGAKEPVTAREELVERIRAHIDTHLRDPRLSPARVAEAHGISLRRLHVLFEGEDTTVHRLVQQRRIEECARELRRRACASRSISAVGRGWGFRNAAHFSRAFRSVYGCSPSEWRAAV
ncbi:helix-turn-helix domain-containing protein [Streptomyces sp. Ru71]|uniref:AraC-like ligand-binding domain-containing protein n=1 Tax=Streptomyces sp. Ru71 TaxID=2080746 RepID=UPI0015E34F8A|nr:helix-turn-helix domain-containing protein [Streptomyces sp. Ru71]